MGRQIRLSVKAAQQLGWIPKQEEQKCPERAPLYYDRTWYKDFKQQLDERDRQASPVQPPRKAWWQIW